MPRTRSLPPTTSFVLPNRLKSGNCREPTTVTITTILRTERVYKLLHPGGKKKKKEIPTPIIILSPRTYTSRFIETSTFFLLSHKNILPLQVYIYTHRSAHILYNSEC